MTTPKIWRRSIQLNYYMERAVKNLDTLKKLASEGRYDEAIKYGMELISETEDESPVHHALGDIFFKNGIPDKSAYHYSMALNKRPNHAWSLYNLARSLDRMGREDCLSFYERTLKQSRSAEFLYGFAKSKFTPVEKKRVLFAECIQKDKKYLFTDWGLQELYPKQMRGDLHDALNNRLERWFRKNSDQYNAGFAGVALLAKKDQARKYALHLGMRIPEIISSGSVEKVAQDTRKCARYVVKPVSGASSKGVIVATDNFDLMRRKRIGDSLTGYYDSHKFSYRNQEFVAEEFVTDFGLRDNPYLIIPRDFKCYAAGGEVFWINVYDRNYPKQSQMTIGCYDSNWRRLPRTTTFYQDADTMEAPDFFEELKAKVATLSKNIPYFMRYDFFMSDGGPVFGEFTHYPSGGTMQTEFGERTQLQLLFVCPDPLDPVHDDAEILATFGEL